MHWEQLEPKGDSINMNELLEKEHDTSKYDICYLSLFSQDVNELNEKRAKLKVAGGIGLCVGLSDSTPTASLQALNSKCNYVEDISSYSCFQVK